MGNKSVKVEHTLREGNQLADLFINFVFNFAGTTNLQFSSNQEAPEIARNIIMLEKK